MVKGLERFREHFKEFKDCYVLIGGSACDLAFSAAGVEFRATKDLDIVLIVESLNAEFARAFWEFVRSGGYEFQESSTGAKKFYRFRKPTSDGYPFMLELFSRVPDALGDVKAGQLTPIPIDDEVSSLSAVLLDGEYYRWIHAGKLEVDGVSIVRPEYLIPLKAKAWLDLRRRKAAGESVDSHDIKKHRNDVFRLAAIVDPEFRAMSAPEIESDMRRFLDEITGEKVDLKAIGIAISMEAAVAVMRGLYVRG